MMLTWALLLLFAATSHQQSLQQPHKPNTLIASTHTPSPASVRRSQAGRSPPEIPLLKHDITTVKFRSTEDDATHQKFNALAPAQDESAVRAPLAQSVESVSGLSALPQARLLQDWEAEDLVLIVTVDGQIQARSRKNGQRALWILEPDSPMIQTTHHCHNKTDEDDDCDHDYIFLVEPSKDGSLYILYKDPQIGLQRLHTTVRELAMDTPNYLDNPPLVTVAMQETTAYVVDAASGTILQQFSKDGGAFLDNEQEQKCRRLTGLELDDPACDSKGTINLGRVEYTIHISSRMPRQNLCTIKYSEWVPNKADADLQAQYVRPLDTLHIQTSFNGKIMGLDHSENKVHRWQGKLDAPVARIFDVVRPIDATDEHSNLVLLSRPLDSPSLTPNELWRNDNHRTEKVFLNQTDTGMWYALSELSYPGVTAGADQARANWYHDSPPIDFQNNMQDLIGVHTILDGQHEPPVRLTIDGRPPESGMMPEPEKALDPPPSNTTEALLSSVSNNLPLVINMILVSIMLMLMGIQLRVPAFLKLQRFLRNAGVEVVIDPGKSPLAPDPPEPVAEQVDVAATEPPQKPAEVPKEIVDITMTTPVRSRTHSSTTMTSSPKKESKMDDDDDNDTEGGSDDEKAPLNFNENGEPTEPKKKAKRGKRGGRKNKKTKSMNPEAMDESSAMVAEVTAKDGTQQIGKLKIDLSEDRCLGRGSNGTAVFPGTLDGREVAVKRLIRSANSLAAKEIKHLLSSDENPHVIRYFGKEESQLFTYIALDLFTTSLDQFIERPLQFPTLVKLPEGFDVKDCLLQITDGVSHLHSLKLVHRDIKPQNVLVKSVKTNRPTAGPPKLLFVISDFGLAKPLEEGPESTFAPTANHTAAGTTGWRAPELLVNYRDGIAAPSAGSTQSRSTNHSADGSTTVIDRPSGRRATKAIDIFSLGCVFYYVMTQGCHPFDIGGTSLGRDLNIKENRFSTEDLRLHNYQFDADDLVMQMLKHEPKHRPDTLAVRRHPYFWPVEDKLDFLCEVSDCYEKEKNSIKNIHDEHAVRTDAELDSLAELAALQELGPDVIGPGNDFLKALPRSFINEMGKQRKYTGSKMIDLLRVIRNKKNHFWDLPEDVRDLMLTLGAGAEKGGEITKGYYEFWAKRFPALLVNCHCLIWERGLVERMGLGRYYAEAS